jgi:hypothetical protein
LKFVRVAWLFACYGTFRFLRLDAAGAVLVASLRSNDQTVSTVGATLLARSGNRATGLLLKAMERRESLPTVLILAGDTGDQRTEDALVSFTADQDDDIARAATDGLKLLHAHQR